MTWPPPSASLLGWYSNQHAKCHILLLSFQNPLNRFVGFQQIQPQGIRAVPAPTWGGHQNRLGSRRGYTLREILLFTSPPSSTKGLNYTGTCNSKTTIPMLNAQGPAAASGQPRDRQERRIRCPALQGLKTGNHHKYLTPKQLYLLI